MRKLFILLLASMGIFLSAEAQTSKELPVDPNVRYGKLENGLTYYIRQNAYPEKRADFYIAQKVGSMQEEDNQAGLAHFLEHMAFNGTKHYPGRKTMLDYLEKNGAKFGANVNAYTSFDETVYNLSDIPVHREGVVDSCLLILHDWSGFITLEDAEIDKERAIIKEEWRTRDNAYMRILDKQLPVLFKDSKYAKRMPIGTMEVVENFPYQVLRDYYHKWYRPDLQAIIIVGDVDADKLEAKIKTMFADIPKAVNPAERIYYPVPDNDEPLIITATDTEATTTQVALYIKHDPISDDIKKTDLGLKDNIVKSLVSQMLSARLSEISKKADAPFAASYAADRGFFVSKTKDAWTTIGVSKEGKIKETLASLVRENERMKRFGFTDSEIERAKSNLIQSYENAYNNRNKERNDRYVDEYVRSFSDNEPIPGIEYEYNYAKQVTPLITKDVFNQFVQSIITGKNVAISVMGPENEELVYPTNEELLQVYTDVEKENITPYEESVSNEPLISKMPKPGKVVKSVVNKNFESTEWTLSNGIKVILKKTDFKDDQIIMSSIAYGGTSLVSDDDIYNAGFVNMVPSIGGIGNFSSTDLTKVLAGKTARINPSISEWTQGFGGSSNIKSVETLFQLTYLYYTAPRKDEDAYKSILEMVKNQLKNQSAEPSSVFSDSIAAAKYGDNPRTKNMKFEDVDKLNYDRIIEIYKQLYANPGSSVFIIVGTVDEVALKPLVEQYLASLPSGNKKASYKNIDMNLRKGIYENTFEREMKTPKTSVYKLYSATLDRNLKNRIGLSALKQILDIVYTETVREEEGGTYGVRTGVGISRIPEGQTSFVASFDTDPDKVAKLSPIIKREMDIIAENGPREVDFNKVKEYMIKKYQEDLKTNGYWSGILLSNYFYGEDNQTDYLSTLNSLTKEDIKVLMKDLLKPGNSIEVIMNPEK